MKREFTMREKVLLLVLIIIVIVAGYYWIVATPVQERITAANAEEMDYQDQIMMEMVRARQLEDMREVLEQENGANEKPVSTIPYYDNLEHVMVELDAILTQALTYSLNFSDVKPAEQMISRPIEMTFTCSSYTAAKNIINNLYCSMYRCTVDNITMSADNKGREGTPDLNQDAVSVSLTVTFYEKIPPEMGGGESQGTEEK